MRETSDTAIADLIKCIPLDQVPSAIALLAARLLTEKRAARHQHYDGSIDQESKTLLTARGLAEHLNLPESWIRNEERLGRIPSVRAGKYVRFRRCNVEEALTERTGQSPKSSP